MRKAVRVAGLLALLIAMLSATGCGPGAVGVGMSVSVPVGTHGYMSMGATRWR